MGHFDTTLLGASPFVRWALTPFLLLFIVLMPLLIDEWNAVRIAIMAGLELVCVALLVAVWCSGRWAITALRVTAGVIFIAYVAYLVHALTAGQPWSRGSSLPGAILGTLLIGLPCLLFAVRGHALVDRLGVVSEEDLRVDQERLEAWAAEPGASLFPVEQDEDLLLLAAIERKPALVDDLCELLGRAALTEAKRTLIVATFAELLLERDEEFATDELADAVTAALRRSPEAVTAAYDDLGLEQEVQLRRLLGHPLPDDLPDWLVEESDVNLLDLLEALWDADIFVEAVDATLKDARRQHRRRRLIVLLVGFFVATGGALLVGMLLGTRPLVSVLAGLGVFIVVTTAMIVVLRRRSTPRG